MISVLPFIQKRIVLAGVNVGSRTAFARMNEFIDQHHVQPAVGAQMSFAQLPQALGLMSS
jgi:D-arabinose 1-dehydrogenase-like Zn-dependent alcohol dehydrogenase